MKKCGRCEIMKEPSAFNRNRAAKDGLQRLCRACQIEANREWRERRPEVYRRMVRAENARRTARGDHRHGSPEARRAHLTVARAIKSGRLVKPDRCGCGASDALQAHHDDYGQPLKVTWLCARCHQRRHRDEKMAAMTGADE